MDPLREDLRKSRLARLSGRENEMTNTASLAFGAQGRSRSYYNKLYKFNAKAELNE